MEQHVISMWHCRRQIQLYVSKCFKKKKNHLVKVFSLGYFVGRYVMEALCVDALR